MKKFRFKNNNHEDFELDDIKQKQRHRREKRLDRALKKRDIRELEDWDNY